MANCHLDRSTDDMFARPLLARRAYRLVILLPSLIVIVPSCWMPVLERAEPRRGDRPGSRPKRMVWDQCFSHGEPTWVKAKCTSGRHERGPLRKSRSG
ncbi:MAG: DUF6338 family protein [Frankia sp.]